ncbi:Altered inheritance of mitochondria protein 6 [Exophiala oligosperma]
MLPMRYNRPVQDTGRFQFTIDETGSATGEDIELGRYEQTHGSSTGCPENAGQSQSRPSRPSLALKIPAFPSSSRSPDKRGSGQPWLLVRKQKRPASRSLSKVVNLLKLSLMLLGILQCVAYVFGVLNALFPDDFDLVSKPFRDVLITPGSPGTWSEDPTTDVQPLMCHSHNDYWRREPLYQALRAGRTGVEADVWYFDDQLYVTHTVLGIRQNRTLKNLYLDPLTDILNRQNQLPNFLGPLDETRNGVFATRPMQTLVLLIDFKNDPQRIWRRLESHLSYFRDKKYLTYFNGTAVVQGPLTIVASGIAPFGRIVQRSTYRDVFYDAPLDVLASLPGSRGPTASLPHYTTDADDSSLIDAPYYPQNAAIYSPANSYYASVSFVRSIGYPWHSTLSQAQLDLLRRQIHAAHSRGLKVR